MICSRFVRDLFVICSQFVRNLFVICLFSIFFVVYSRIVRDLFANCLQIICSPLFTNKANKTRISRSLFAFFKNHECSFVFYFGLFVDTLLPVLPLGKQLFLFVEKACAHFLKNNHQIRKHCPILFEIARVSTNKPK